MDDNALASPQKAYSAFRSGRSMALMLPPIKPTETEDETKAAVLVHPVENKLNSVEKEEKIIFEKKKATKSKTLCNFAKNTEAVNKNTTKHKNTSVDRFGCSSNEKPSNQPMKISSLLTTYKELDTVNLAKKVKDVLIANNIGQRIFGQAVLGLTQGSVSDLLSHPKPWNLLSLKGREPFIRMQIWLDDPNNVELIRQLKLDSGSISSTTSNRFGYQHPAKKKNRVVLSGEDKMVLLNAYSCEAYPKPATVYELAQKLNKKPSTIVNWFHNYRSRVKRGISSESKFSKLPAQNKKESESLQSNINCRKDATKQLETFSLKTSSSECISQQVLTTCNATDPNLNTVATINAHPSGQCPTSASMLLTATVLLGSAIQPVAPLWSLQVENNDPALTSSDCLTALLLNVCSPTSSDDTQSILTREDEQSQHQRTQKTNCLLNPLSKSC